MTVRHSNTKAGIINFGILSTYVGLPRFVLDRKSSNALIKKTEAATDKCVDFVLVFTVYLTYVDISIHNIDKSNLSFERLESYEHKMPFLGIPKK